MSFKLVMEADSSENGFNPEYYVLDLDMTLVMQLDGYSRCLGDIEGARAGLVLPSSNWMFWPDHNAGQKHPKPIDTVLWYLPADGTPLHQMGDFWIEGRYCHAVEDESGKWSQRTCAVTTVGTNVGLLRYLLTNPFDLSQLEGEINLFGMGFGTQSLYRYDGIFYVMFDQPSGSERDDKAERLHFAYLSNLRARNQPMGGGAA